MIELPFIVLESDMFYLQERRELVVNIPVFVFVFVT
jgi:hypothetical protein